MTTELYDLLPALHRLRDEESGGPLRALLDVLAEQFDVVADDVARLYDDWFVETCDEWVVPYLGDLVGVAPLHERRSLGSVSERARVANTVSYRRRKGTVAMLEALARDVTGWPARAVEMFSLLAWTQHVNHVRPAAAVTADLRRGDDLGLVGGAFDPFARTVDVRPMSRAGGDLALGSARPNVPNVGLFVWRLGAYLLGNATARPVADPPDGRYTVDPLGAAVPLANPPRTEREITDLADETTVPGFLRLRPLAAELEARRQALVDGVPFATRWFGERPVFRVFVRRAAGDPLVEVPPERVLICRLDDAVAPLTGWRRPPATREYQPSAGGAKVALPVDVAVDPRLGRVAFPAGVVPARVEVTAAYAAPGDVGGGPYGRHESYAAALGDRELRFHVAVSVHEPANGDRVFGTLGEAVAAWNALPEKPQAGLITVLDSHRYAEDLVAAGAVRVPAGSTLLIVAAAWPRPRADGAIEPSGVRPVLAGDLEVVGTAAPGDPNAGGLVLDGFVVDGRIGVRAGGLGRLELRHCTVPGGVTADAAAGRLTVALHATLCGPVTVPGEATAVEATGSVVGGPGGVAVAAPESVVSLTGVTAFGTVTARELTASDCVFVDPVVVARRQAGCVRFSWVPAGSATPRRYRCQPDLALTDVPDAQHAAVRGGLTPSFTSETLGDPAYAQLARSCAPEITAGASDGAEMGAYGVLRQPHRVANLSASLDEYLPFGLAAGLIPVT